MRFKTCSGKEIYHFCFVFESKFHVQAPRGAYIRRGDLTEGFLCYDFEGLIHGGAYFRRMLITFFRPEASHVLRECDCSPVLEYAKIRTVLQSKQ